jgi:hypothetical protein
MSTIYISKSQFLKGLQCPKSLYLQKYHPELAGEVSESREALFKSGKEVGVLARGLHPGGVEILFDAKNFARQLELTKEYHYCPVKIEHPEGGPPLSFSVCRASG